MNILHRVIRQIRLDFSRVLRMRASRDWLETPSRGTNVKEKGGVSKEATYDREASVPH